MNYLVARVSPFTAFHLIYGVTMLVCMLVALSALLLGKHVWRSVKTSQIGSRRTVALISGGVVYWLACAVFLVVFMDYIGEQLKVIGY